MDSPAACASCAMPTSDESSQSTAGTTHSHRSTSSLLAAVGKYSEKDEFACNY